MISGSQQLPKPKNWQDFERLCTDLFAALWEDDETKCNGRTGQAQHGVDIYGRPGKGQHWAGVQCKGKGGAYGKTISKRELEDEVEKARSFVPPLTQFFIATTAPDDARIDEHARVLTAANRERGLFSVSVWGWETLHLHISRYDHVSETHFDTTTTQLLVRMLDQERQVRAATAARNEELNEAIRALQTKAVEDLSARARTAKDDKGTAAFDALAEGDLQKALEILGSSEEDHAGAIQTNLRAAARDARTFGLLAMFSQPEPAAAALRRATQYEPGNPWNWYALGDCLFRKGDLDLAAKQYGEGMKVSQHTPDVPDANELRDWVLFKDHNFGYGMLSVAEVHLAQGRSFDQLMLSYEFGLSKAERIPPGSIMFKVAAARLWCGHNRYGDLLLPWNPEKALWHFQKATQIAIAVRAAVPGETNWMRWHAITLDSAGDAFARLQDYQSAADRYAEAKELFTVLRTKVPDDPLVSDDVAVCLRKIGELQLAEQKLLPARRTLIQAARLSPLKPQNVTPRLFSSSKRADLLLYLGKVCLGLGQLRKASSYFMRAEKSLGGLAMTYSSKKHFIVARAHLDFEIAYALDRSAQLQAAIGHYRAAAGFWKDLLRDDPTESEFETQLLRTLHHLGMCLRASGAKDEAYDNEDQSLEIALKLLTYITLQPRQLTMVGRTIREANDLLIEDGHMDLALQTLGAARLLLSPPDAKTRFPISFLAEMARAFCGLGKALLTASNGRSAEMFLREAVSIVADASKKGILPADFQEIAKSCEALLEQGGSS